jgi:hypothetical protein
MKHAISSAMFSVSGYTGVVQNFRRWLPMVLYANIMHTKNIFPLTLDSLEDAVISDIKYDEIYYVFQ